MIVPLSQFPKINKLRTNIFYFDLLTKGGIPLSKITLFVGNRSSGKTTFAIKVADIFLQTYENKKVLFIDTENALNQEWAMQLISDNNRFLVAQTSYLEETLKIFREAVKDETISFVVLDSIATLISLEEVDTDKNPVGFLARAFNTLLRKIFPSVNERQREGNPLTLLFINQIRSNIQAPVYMNSYSLPAGVSQEFVASLIVRFYQGKIEKKDDIPTIQEINFTVEKNKTGGVPKVAGVINLALRDFDIYKAGDIVQENTLLEYLKRYNLLEKGKKYKVLDFEFETQSQIKQALKEDRQFLRQVIDKLMEMYYEMYGM